MRAFDFFCGAGGLTRGLLDAGIQVTAGFDTDEQCRQSYEYNNKGAKFICRDIRQISVQELRQLAGVQSFETMLFAGCAPCQPFSQQRKGEMRIRDATLLAEFGRLVHEARPGWVFSENVPGISRVAGYSTFRRFLRLLEADGYYFTYGIVDAKDFGVPQTRRRLVLVACLKGGIDLPRARFGSPKRPFRTVREAISHFPPIRAGECHCAIPNHVAASITEINLQRLAYTPHNGGDRREWPDALRLDCHRGKYGGHTDVYGRLAWDSPAPTLTGRCHSISNGRYGHPEQDRAISLREAAALQSFPDRYEFFGSNKHIARQIGNAVPVLLAQELGRYLIMTTRSVSLQAGAPGSRPRHARSR